jgi:hypothetical protein
MLGDRGRQGRACRQGSRGQVRSGNDDTRRLPSKVPRTVKGFDDHLVCANRGKGAISKTSVSSDTGGKDCPFGS